MDDIRSVVSRSLEAEGQRYIERILTVKDRDGYGKSTGDRLNLQRIVLL